ncbi:thermonuclease family protein [Paracoccus laeviglucosivorans]|uniref:Nuclease homologue n=1 Tax=Paracoccus laeviglucosivorans TaxID=1197861 RepID=A0A521FL87_9RHOB|nr:thermonuclease family protein [Paracoccus laeviglucosivorans]SMO96231.1 nuclease homologue [Paracoccus laeviglucosivorans]
MITCLAAICLSGAVAIDGDTLRLDSPGKNLRLRLWGIQAPEIKEAGGAEARHALAALVSDRPVACDLMDVDRYGRPVVRCHTDTVTDLSCEMVRQGHATDWRRYSGGAYQHCNRIVPAAAEELD